jgi:ABC-type multidrug transport system ATPase subunit
MPVYVRWTKYIAYFWYAFGALVSNQFSDWMGECPFDNAEQCVEYSGNHQLSVLGYPQGWIGEPIGILVAWFIGFQLIAALGVYYRSSDIKFAKTKINRIGGEETADQVDSGTTKSTETTEKMDRNEGIELQIDDINLAKKDFQLLDSISATFHPCTINVIMGPSGSGKTTLLNYLSNRISQWTLKATGLISINNTAITPTQLKQMSAYVTQHDNSLIPTLTVRETLYYQAKLRLPVEEHGEIPFIINKLIRQMGLSDCAETLIGSDLVKGISGGEKRRVSIGIQLLSKPKVLFLDEPTSGLDSKTSVTILKLLADLALDNSTTVILTIHQPNEEMFMSFGSVLLLARGGKVVFDGATSKIRSYLNDIGYGMSSNQNIADYLLDLVSGGPDESPEIVFARVSSLVNGWKLSVKPLFVTNGTFNYAQYFHKRLPLKVTLPTTFERQFLSTVRDRDMLMTRATQIIILTIVHTLYFAPLKNTEDGIANRLGLIQEVLNLYYVGLISNIAVYPIQKDLFYQEYRDGIYGVLEFNVSYFLNELPTEIIPCLVFSALIVFGVGLPRTAGMFFAMFCTGFLSINIGESLGIMVNSVFNHLGVATNILTNIVIVAIFMGGTMSIHMPGFFRGINYINPMKYAVGINAVLGFENQVFECLVAGCALGTGEQVLQSYNLDINVGAFFGGLVACFVIYRLLAISSVWIRVRYLI